MTRSRLDDRDPRRRDAGPPLAARGRHRARRPAAAGDLRRQHLRRAPRAGPRRRRLRRARARDLLAARRLPRRRGARTRWRRPSACCSAPTGRPPWPTARWRSTRCARQEAVTGPGRDRRVLLRRRARLQRRRPQPGRRAGQLLRLGAARAPRRRCPSTPSDVTLTVIDPAAGGHAVAAPLGPGRHASSTARWSSRSAPCSRRSRTCASRPTRAAGTPSTTTTSCSTTPTLAHLAWRAHAGLPGGAPARAS